MIPLPGRFVQIQKADDVEATSRRDVKIDEVVEGGRDDGSKLGDEGREDSMRDGELYKSLRRKTEREICVDSNVRRERREC